MRRSGAPVHPSRGSAAEPRAAKVVVVVRPGMCVVNVSPVAASVAVTGADPAAVAVPPFAARGVLLPSFPVCAVLAVTLDGCATSAEATPGMSRCG